MIHHYFRAKRIVVFAIGGVILFQIGKTELLWSSNYVRTLAVIEKIERTCADGRSGRIRYVDCSSSMPGADRRTTLDLSYISPADGLQHQARVRCDTGREATPLLLVGQQLEVLAHKNEPERLDRRRCTSMIPPATHG